MNYWFTSDWHLYHTNIIKYANRPFENVEEMNNTIITNFNELVKEDDIVYYLGDFIFEKHWGNFGEKFKSIMSKVNGKWVFIKGNHDYFINHGLQSYQVEKLLDIKIKNQPITLCHYPMHTFNKSHFNAWQLYGHHHKEIELDGKRMNVCVDVNNFKPVNFEKVKEYMDKQIDNWDFIR